jgi:hypothetical protein
MENGLRSAIEKIEDMAQRENTQIFDINGEKYCLENLKKVEKEFYSPRQVELNSLSSLVDIIQVELGKAFVPLFVRIVSTTKVEVFSTYHDLEDHYKRDHLYAAVAELPSIKLNSFVEHEDFMISLRSKFVENEDVSYLLDLLSKITDENSVDSEDNGLSQTVQARKGIALVQNVKVRSKVMLAPYRTFLEVEQPTSEFLVRLKEGGYIGLFEADGGAWNLDAKRGIRSYLEAVLVTEINDGDVVVIA